MACRTLLRRKTQLDLLRTVCEQGRRAFLSLRGRRTVSHKVTLESIESDGLICSWMDDHIAEAEVAGQPLEFAFEHKGEHFIFQAVSRGATRHGTARGLRVSLPPRVERARRRRQLRLEAPADPPMECSFTQVVDERRQFRGCITDFSDGGVGVVAQTNEVSQLYTGDLYWLTLTLPDNELPLELVVRLIHLRPIRHTDRLAMGWAFQPSDDRTQYEQYVRRLEALIDQDRRSSSVAG